VDLIVLQVALLFVIGIAGGYLAVWTRAWLEWRPLLSRRVVINLKTGRAVDGLLVRRTGDLLFLRSATALEPGAQPAPLDGEAVVLRTDIDFIQAL
jgi:hypothetical protein